MAHKGAYRLVLLLFFVVAAGYFLGSVTLTTYENILDEKRSAGVQLPVVMYHAVLKDTSRSGKFVITPEEFERDMDYLLERGYTPVHIADLIAYVDGAGQLPEKPVMITFDDGYYNNYLYVFPVIQEKNVKIVLSPIAKYSQLYTETGEKNGYYSHITWPMAREMAESGLVELQNHSYDMHANQGDRSGARRMPGESGAAYRAALQADLTQAHKLIAANTGQSPSAFTYPFGGVSPESYGVIQGLGYRASLSCEAGMNTITPGDMDCLYLLKRYNRPSGKATEAFFRDFAP